jgi:hypothetical protein
LMALLMPLDVRIWRPVRLDEVERVIFEG